MSKPLLLRDDALIDLSLALGPAPREEERVIERLPMMVDDIQSNASAPMLFERIVWLARRSTLALAPPAGAVAHRAA